MVLSTTIVIANSNASGITDSMLTAAAVIEECCRNHDGQEQQNRIECDLQQGVRNEPVIEETDHARLRSSIAL